MTEKLLTFPSPTPSPPLLPPQTLGMGSIGKNSTFFQNSINTNQQQRHLYRDNMRGSRNFVLGGIQAPQLILQFTEGVQWFNYTFSRGVQLFLGGGGVQLLISIETHISITCDFPGGGGGVWTPYPPSGSAHGQCGILARIGSASF